jgi:hypothetical protein
MSRSMYDVCEEHTAQRMKADLILRVFWSNDTSELDKIILKITDMVGARFDNMSTTFHALSARTRKPGEARTAKHAYFLFGLYLIPEFARTLLQPTPVVDPTKFRLFYTTELPTLCNNLLTGVYTSMSEFVEMARSAYILL